MRISEIKAEARNALKGQWGKTILTFIIYLVTSLALSFFLSLIPLFGAIISCIISIPLSVGLASTLLKITKRIDCGHFDFINVAIELFGKSWGVVGHTLLKMWKPLVLFIVSIVLSIIMTFYSTLNLVFVGQDLSSLIVAKIIPLLSSIFMTVSVIWMIVRGLLYSLSNLILVDNPDMNTKDIVEKSSLLMSGKRFKLILLILSFFGWALLSSITLGIGYIWLAPYISITEVVFYLKLAESSEV